MLESTLQRKIITTLTEAGWYVIKLILTSKNGCPDLLCIRNGVYVFIEAKQKGKKPTKLQLYRHHEIDLHEGEVLVVDDITLIEHLL